MRTARAYDTHKMVKEMIVLGFSEKQSEGVVNLFGQVQGDLATKSDLQEVKAELKSDLKEVEMRLENKIEKAVNALRIEMRDMHSSLIRWFIGALFAAVGIILTALKLFL